MSSNEVKIVKICSKQTFVCILAYEIYNIGLLPHCFTKIGVVGGHVTLVSALCPTALLPAVELQRHVHSLAAFQPTASLNVAMYGGHVTETSAFYPIAAIYPER